MTGLFSPISIKSVEIKNRVVLPPMVRFGWSDEKGFVTDRHIKHYSQIAMGGAGLIIIEALAIAEDGKSGEDQLGIWSDDHIEGIGKIAEACHRYGSVVTAQIQHAGLKTPISVSKIALAPSGCKNNGHLDAKALNIKEIQKIQEQFVDASVRAKKAGLDGIEFHGAHGYLIDQFLSPITNRRNDSYGGSLAARATFVRQMIEKVKSSTDSDDFIIGYRMGGNEPTLDEGRKIAKILENSGIDLLHVSSGIEDSTIPKPPPDFEYNWIVYCGTEIKKQVRIPVIVVNGIKTPDQAKYLIENDLADFIAVGRGQLCDMDWANKAKDNLKVIKCLECAECFWFNEIKKCPRYNFD
jgi:2,4-dienoyl-CoA reductase-like NADH-dependent reductase (Old Yellow Enzyme family)